MQNFAEITFIGGDKFKELSGTNIPAPKGGFSADQSNASHPLGEYSAVHVA